MRKPRVAFTVPIVSIVVSFFWGLTKFVYHRSLTIKHWLTKQATTMETIGRVVIQCSSSVVGCATASTLQMHPGGVIQDDGTCFGDSLQHSTSKTRTINKLLHAMQTESQYYNMKLNYDKCINLTLKLTLYQGQPSIKLHRWSIRTHASMRQHNLGSILTDTVDNHREVTNAIPI